MKNFPSIIWIIQKSVLSLQYETKIKNDYNYGKDY